MRRTLLLACGMALAAAIAAPTLAAPKAKPQGAPARPRTAANPRIELNVEKRGKITVELLKQHAPKTTAHILSLVNKKFYDGIRFHRVRPGFMAQVGDPESRKFKAQDMAGKSDDELAAMGLGMGGSGKNVPLEAGKVAHERGTLGMARSSDPNSGDSQFFINFVPNHRLDDGYTVFGKVVKGMDVVDKIEQGDRLVTVRQLKPPAPAKSKR